MFIAALFTIARTGRQPRCPSADEWTGKLWYIDERLLLNQAKTPGFLAPGGEEFNRGPETRLDRSELLCNKVLLKYKGDKKSF